MDKNQANGRTGWEFLQDRKQKANPAALKSAVYTLIGMTTQKTGGEQANSRRKDIPFATLDMVKLTIICEATALVLSGKLDEITEEQKHGDKKENG